MSQITEQECQMIEHDLQMHETAIEKLAGYLRETNDAEVRSLVQHEQSLYQRHYDELRDLIQSQAGQAGQVSQTDGVRQNGNFNWPGR